MTSHAEPLGGRVITGGYKLLLAIVGIGVLLMAWRFFAGLGRTTALNDGYPWGFWIAFEVVTGTALACGGYAVAILCYVLNKGKYHPLVRPAILTSALGYTVAGFSVILDLGRYWLVYRVFMPWRWNLNSVLLEVALCITAYTLVLWIELAPAFLAKWKDSPTPWIRNVSRTVGARLDNVLLFILALGLLLPTMHQSSLGSLMLVAGSKLNGLWHTPWLPLLFLISCLAMGYAIVVIESLLSGQGFRRKPETPMLRSLAKVMVGVQLLFLVVRFLDLGISGKLAGIAFDRYGILLAAEVLLFAAPAFLLLGRRPASQARLFTGALLMLVAGGLYRFDTYLLAFDPGPNWTYFPAVTEIMISAGLVSAEVALYIAIVKRFPILAGSRSSASARTQARRS